MSDVAKAMERLRPWLPLRENASFSGAFDAIYSGAHADVVTLWQDALFREQKFEEQKQSLDEEWGAQPKDNLLRVMPEDSQRRSFDLLYEKARELEAEKAQLEAALAREERKSEALSEKVEEGRSDLDAARENAEHYQVMFDATERQRDEWKARAEAAEARTTPAVTKHDIEKAVDRWWARPGSQEDLERDLWSLVSGDDPAVYVVRESDLPEAERDEDGDWIVDGGFIAASQTTAETVRGWIPAYLRSETCLEAVARAIEAEQAKDPVEAKAIELHQVAYGGRIGFGHATLNAQEMFRSLARHVLGQEADQ